MRDNDQIYQKLVEYGEKFEQTVTKTEFQVFRQEQLSANEEMITILKRLDEERCATIEWIRRLEGDSNDLKKKNQEHDVSIQKIKEELHLSF